MRLARFCSGRYRAVKSPRNCEARYETRRRYLRLSDISGGCSRDDCRVSPVDDLSLALRPSVAGLPLFPLRWGADDCRRASGAAAFVCSFRDPGTRDACANRSPERLLVNGLYRYVRNPMYVAVSLLIFGQGLLFGSVRVLEYGIVVWLGFLAFVVFYEEPALRGKFGKEYEEYCARVPRWIPRLKPVEPLRQ
jgi:hypothetical protein